MEWTEVLAMGIRAVARYSVRNGCSEEEARRRLSRTAEKRREGSRGRVLWDSKRLGTATRVWPKGR